MKNAFLYIVLLVPIFFVGCAEEESGEKEQNSVSNLKVMPQTYITFQGDTLHLYKYVGTKTMILANSPSLDTTTMAKWVDAMDGTYNYYALCTGREPAHYTPNYWIDNRATIARVDATCGAGCGYLGWTGIELLNKYFDNFYTNLLNNHQYSQEPFYEFGRNFWFYSDQLQYTDNDPIVTGYAVFMRFMSMDYLGLSGADFYSWSYNQFEDNVKDLLNKYMENPNYTWATTLGVGKGIIGSGLNATDLFASFCFYLFDHYGGQKWVQNVWKFAEKRPKANTTQEAVDNFIIASSQAANVNLVSLFQYWRWPISQFAIDYLNSLN